MYVFERESASGIGGGGKGMSRLPTEHGAGLDASPSHDPETMT